MTAFRALGNAQAINTTLQGLPDRLESAGESITLLEERASDDQVAINRAESVTSATAVRADLLEVELQSVNRLIRLLESSINNVTLIPESRYLALKRDIDSLENMMNQMEQNIENVASEVSILQDQSEILETKYAELRRHRDLLNSIKSEIQNLDCDSLIIG